MGSPRIGSASGVIAPRSSTFRPRASGERKSMVSRARSFRSRLFSSKGAFFRRLRILRITSVARWLLDEISPTISPSSAISGLGDFRMISALSVLNRIAPSGWFISWAIKAVSSPAVEKRLTRASSAVRCRDCTSANCRRRCSCSRSEISAGLHQDNRRDQANLPGIPFPHRWLPKQDLAPRRQPALADVPALKLSPIVFRCCESDRRNLDAICLLSSQHPDGNGSSRSGTLGR